MSMSMEDRVNKHLERLQEISEEIKDINRAIVEANLDDSPILLMQHLRELTSYLARVDMLYAETEMILSYARAYWSETLDSKLQATRFKEILDGKVAIEQQIHRQVERTHKTLNTTINALITQISYLKEEMRLAGRGD